MDSTSFKLLMCANVTSTAALSSTFFNDPNLLYSTYSYGTRTPADKISNYIIVYSSDLTIGGKYAYIMTTSGERTANRQLANGTVIISRGYNSASWSAERAATTYQMLKDNGIGYTFYNSAWIQLSDMGTFTYDPRLITAADGSSATGHLISKNTFNVSDPGKGDANCYVYDLNYMINLCSVYGIPFVDNNNNTP